MSTADADIRKKVFRVRGLPNPVKTRDDAASLLSRAFGLSTPGDIVVSSLATTLDYWESPPSRVCTLQLKVVPQCFATPVRPGEWHISLGDANGTLIVDTHFIGLTPLNDVDESCHALDVIAISGLGGHPFGSWQPRHSDKGYMWIRDEIPSCLSGSRAILYGYDTSLADGDSFQSVRDIARGFVEQLQASGWQLDGAPPLVFLAHSLGGIVLMDSLLQIANCERDADDSILDKVRGAIFFGVPTLGMEQSSLQAMTEGQLNETLVQDLSRESNYLRSLTMSYFGVSKLRQLQVSWAYETRSSPTVEKGADGRWARTGRHQILVDRHSATYRNIDKDQQSTFPITENHSDLVKFNRGDANLRTVIAKMHSMFLSQKPLHGGNSSPPLAEAIPASSRVSNLDTPLESTLEDVLASLKAPDLDARITGIEDRFGKSFDWVYELQEFTTWLQKGTGIFWINGKPGSGKSTLMKFITQNSKTWDLVHDFQRGALEISAAFFFHFRGSFMQKSFEGVLRSLIKQILTNAPDLFKALRPVLPKRQGSVSLWKWTISDLERCLAALLEQNTLEVDMCLFFDALDEFDGHHAFICNFLKGLANPRPTTRTRVKVCFSSRPWDVFESNLGDSKRLKLQDHTGSDIWDYCLTSMSPLGLDPPSIEDLVQAIISRAEGVFLWVKLVLRQLAQEHSKNRVLSLANMRATIESLPTELDDYYVFILDRIPHSLRWQTYALLDTLIRTNDADPSEIFTYFVFATVLVSDCRTYTQAVNKIEAAPLHSMASSIVNWSGGLAEIINKPTSNSVQLMHQTVHEFVKSRKFKERVLGKLHAKIVHENGHTFLAKFQLVNIFRANTLYAHVYTGTSAGSRHVLTSPRHHLLAAEATTGRSLATFFADMPSEAFRMTVEAFNESAVATSLLGLAAASGLRLLICDLAEQNPSEIRDAESNPLACVLGGSNGAKYETTAVLVEKGFAPHKKTAESLWPLLLRVSALEVDASRIDWVKLGKLECDLTLSLIDRGWNAMQVINFGQMYDFFRRAGYGINYHYSCVLLHFALPQLTKSLLAQGVDPNVTDARGGTPIDWILDRVSFPAHAWHVQKARVLADAGGRPRRTKWVSWQIAMQFLSQEQLNDWTREGWILEGGTAPRKQTAASSTIMQRLKDQLVRSRK